MLIRIVKMEFETESIPSFLQNFGEVEMQIRTFPGCLFLELLQDKENQNIFFTHSHWEDETSLQKYRNSELFKTVWVKTRARFRCKAQAWSLKGLK